MARKSIIVFGGAFSPPTLAHEAIIALCLGLPGVDEVWLLPSGHRTDKVISVAPEHQLAMLHIEKEVVFQRNKRLKIDDREVRRGIATETDDTYRELRKEHPGTDFWFVYGADSYAYIHAWQNGEWLAKNLPVLIAPRQDAHLPMLDSHIRFLPKMSQKLQQISSTAVREKLLASKSVSAHVSKPIQDYIAHHYLFS